MSTTNNIAAEPRSRSALRSARRVLIKAGTSVVANPDGLPSLTRLGAISEQISELVRSGTQVIFVSSGAVGMGRQKLKKQDVLSMSLKDLQRSSNHGGSGNKLDSLIENVDATSTKHVERGMHRNSSFASLLKNNADEIQAERKKTYDCACAAAGQFEMMNLYNNLFSQCGVSASQLLVTQIDFQDSSRLQNITYTIERLLSLGIIPIINENDAISANTGYDKITEGGFSDNDGLAALCARAFNCEVTILLTDVDGVYDKPPSEDGAKKLDFYRLQQVKIGDKSALGRGGMGAKIEAAKSAVAPGSRCEACVIAPGKDLNSVRSILSPTYSPSFGPPKGTLFTTPGSDLEEQALSELKLSQAADVDISEEAREMATAARAEARKLQALPYDERQKILNSVADALIEKKDEILESNALDLAVAVENKTAIPLVKRLKLTDEKIQTLAAGIRQIAEQQDPLGEVKSKRELADGLILTQVTVPIGVLMIIFESRPDSMPQIASLALASGNGLMLKGGKEATHSNAAIHKVIGDAIESGSDGKIKRDIIALVTSRGQVADMLSLDDVIDLVIPRGSNALVSYIKANTRIPVLGHADGVCHVYVDSSADPKMASKIVVDSKIDYPSACNAMETLLLHKDLLENGFAFSILMSLRSNGVKCLGGPCAMKSGVCDIAAEELKCEYGDLTCMVEIVDSPDAAINWIHKYGSGHTESIVCDPLSDVGEYFQKNVDAACVFKNCSTRFADGFRFGLGAEVGISTGRIHSRGPVGVEGLLTTKWQLRSNNFDVVGEFAGDDAAKKYTHKELM